MVRPTMEGLDEEFKLTKNQPPKRVVKEIRASKDIPTQAITHLLTTERDNIYRKKLIDEGLTDVVLGFLSRCENENFQDVVGTNQGSIPYPSIWVNLLANTVGTGNLPPDVMKSTRLQIAEGIGPMVSCMCNSKKRGKREFFGSNTNWHMSVHMFAGLLQNLVLTPETVPILVKYDGLVDFVVQSMFWRTYCPDLVEESKPHQRSFETVCDSSISTLLQLVAAPKITSPSGQVSFSVKDQKRIEMIATTFITDRAFNEEKSKTTFGEGLIYLLEDRKSMPVGGRDELFYTLQVFAVANCVDREMVVGILKICANSCTHLSDVMYGLVCFQFMIHRGGSISDKRNDGPFAVAIKAGFFEICVKLLVRFGDRGKMGPTIKRLFGLASACAMFKKSSKAISDNCAKIKAAVSSAKSHLCGGNLELVKVVDVIVSRNATAYKYDDQGDNKVDLGYLSCRQCLQDFSRKDLKGCGKCKRALYCSRECQLDDWKYGGHKQDCALMVTSGSLVKQGGGKKKAMKAAEDYENKISMAGSIVFDRNLVNIVTLATLQRHNILDCVILIDLSHTPASIDIEPSTEFLELNGDAFMRRVVQKNRSDEALTVGVMASFDMVAQEKSMIMKSYPGTKPSYWTDFQSSVKRQERVDEMLRIDDAEGLAKWISRLNIARE